MVSISPVAIGVNGGTRATISRLVLAQKDWGEQLQKRTKAEPPQDLIGDYLKLTSEGK